MDTNQQQQNQQQNQPGINPSLAELDLPNQQQQQQNQPAGGDQQQQQQDKPPGTEDKKPEEGEDTGENANDQEGTDDENGDEQEDPAAFYAEISKLRGDNFEFKFPQDVDPTTPAGVHHAINQVLEHELDNFENDLMKGDPRAYAYMLHRANGGNDEDFFATKTEVLPEWDVLKGSVDLQQAFYRRVLARKEIAPEEADLIVKNAIEKNKLTAVVETEYNRMKKQDEDQARQLLKVSEENQRRQEQMINRMGAVLQEKIIDNKGLGITIPDAKRGNFLQFVNQLVHLDAATGQWYLQQTITNDNINPLLESLYYLSVGGNMNEIISNRAKAENVKQLKLNMGKSKDKVKTGSKDNPNKAEKPGIQPALSTI